MLGIAGSGALAAFWGLGMSSRVGNIEIGGIGGAGMAEKSIYQLVTHIFVSAAPSDGFLLPQRA